MKRIGILSDTHGYLDPAVFDFFKDCDELWHAGDFGSGVVSSLQSFKPLRAVFGNIDGAEIRNYYPRELYFNCEGFKVFIVHVGGYPPRFEPGIMNKLKMEKPQIFVCGHSHILKIMRAKEFENMLCINPGAAGKSGFHKTRTIVRLKIEGKNISDLQVIELGQK